MTPKRLRDGRNTSRRVGSRRGGRRTQNLPSENPSDQTIQNEDIVDETVTNSKMNVIIDRLIRVSVALQTRL
jgi:hypothetical protein